MNPVVRVVIGVAIFAALVGVYLLSYFLNKKTKKPAGCEEMTADCQGCQITSCGHNPGEGDKQ